MKTDVRLFAAPLALALGVAALAVAAPPGPYSNTPTAESRGPLSEYIYKNDDGVFELEVGGMGTAKYRWKDGKVYSDVIKFVREATFYTEEESHKGWIYEASGDGNTWWLFFGSTPMGKDEHSQDLFPLYYSQEDPTKNKFDRWRTQSGTQRLRLASGLDYTANYGRYDSTTYPTVPAGTTYPPGAANPADYRAVPRPLQR